MAIKTTSLRIEEDYLDQVKILAIKKKTTQQEIINNFIKEGLKRENEL